MWLGRSRDSRSRSAGSVKASESIAYYERLSLGDPRRPALRVVRERSADRSAGRLFSGGGFRQLESLVAA